MRKELFKYFLCSILFLACQSLPGKTDISLIVPGRGAEGYTLGAKFKEDEETSVVMKKSPSTLSQILGISGMPFFTFDQAYYLKNHAVVFTRHNVIEAVAGLHPAKRVTDSAVKLSDGADSFIINYGNIGLEILRDGKHRIYMYRKLGIAIFDDSGDNSIDMFLVFNPF